MNKSKHLSENKFLLSLIKNGNKDNKDFPNKTIPEGFDWEYLLEESKKEGIFYPIYEKLFFLDSRSNVLPDEARGKLKQAYYSYISQSTDFSRQTDEILSFLESSGLKVLLLKGPGIDSLIYREAVFRPRLDIDFAARSKDMITLHNLLSNHGYYLDAKDDDYPIPEFVNSCLYFKKKQGAVPLHVHRHIINNLYLMIMGDLNIDMQSVWRETEPFKEYKHIFCLKPELQFLYMCDHALKHNYERLIFLYEIDRLINYYKDEINWDKLVSLGKELNLAFVLYYGLYFAKEILSTDIPENKLELFKPRKLTLAEKFFIKRTFERKPITYLSYVVYFAAYKGWVNKIKFLFLTIFPPNFTILGYLKRIRRFIFRRNNVSAI